MICKSGGKEKRRFCGGGRLLFFSQIWYCETNYRERGIAMKSRKILAAFAVFALAAGFLGAQNLPIVAVAPFEAVSGISAADADTITEVFNIRLRASGAFRVVDRSVVSRVLDEHRFQAGDWSNKEKTAEIGGALNAAWIVRGRISRLGSNLVITATFFDINSFEMMNGGDVLVANVDAAYAGMNPLVESLTRVAGIVQTADRPNANANPVTNAPTNLTVPTLSWTGNWSRDGTNRYVSNGIRDNEQTWQTLTVNAPTGGRIRVTMTVSSESACDYAFASTLNGSRSATDYRLRMSGEESHTFAYEVRPGTSSIYFGYKKDGSVASGNDRVIVEAVAEVATGEAGRKYNIGDTGPGGGLVFYDKGFTSDGWRYLEAAPASTEFPAYWGAYEQGLAGTGTAIGSGRQNTRLIVNHLNGRGENGRAAQRCAALNVNGFNDWFLPSRGELDLVYANLARKGLSGFKTTEDNTNYTHWYWSSSQIDTYDAWVQSFVSGGQYYASKPETSSVRAVRAF